MVIRGKLSTMNRPRTIFTALLFYTVTTILAEDYEANFKEMLDVGWSFVREDKKEWRLAEGQVELLAQPANIWGKANNGTKNLLLRALPSANSSVEVVVDFNPRKKYEQAGLMLYVDDDNYIKLNRELINGQFCVMILEDGASPKLVKRIPFREGPIHLRLDIVGGKVNAWVKAPDEDAWIEHGETTLPGKPDAVKVGIFALNGDTNAPRWAKFSRFKLSAK